MIQQNNACHCSCLLLLAAVAACFEHPKKFSSGKLERVAVGRNQLGRCLAAEIKNVSGGKPSFMYLHRTGTRVWIEKAEALGKAQATNCFKPDYQPGDGR